MKKRAFKKLVATFVLAGVTVLSLGGHAMAAGGVNVYSYRQAYLVEPLFKGFIDETGIKVNEIFAKKGLNEKEPEQKEWAASVKFLLPNSADRGKHVNISGASRAKHAPNKESGTKLIEFLSGDNAQKIYASVNHEYPVKWDVASPGLVKSRDDFNADSRPLEEIAKLRKRATELVAEADFNDGPSS